MLQVGDKVQLTLEKAVEMEINKDTKFDPLNSVFEIESKLTEDILYIREVSTRLQFVGINPKDVIKVEGEPRHIERRPEKRPSKDEYYLGIAKQVASRSTCLRRKYGAIIVRNDVIISTGYNGSPRGEHNCSDKGLCVRQVMNMAHNSGDYSLCRSVHAEQNAIINAARQGTSLLDGTLYLYGYDCAQKKTIDATPCPICNRMIQNAGIKNITTSKETED
jgi:dCMP deaminase